MDENLSAAQFDQIIEFLIALMRYRRRMMATLPDEVSSLKAKLDKLHLGEMGRRNADHDLMFRLGVVLSRQETPLPMGELSKALAVPLSTATRIVDGLVDNGFATRVADPDDRRVVRITLTEDGREMYRVLGEYMRQRIQHILHPLTAQEQNQLVSLLGKVADSMDEGGD